MFKTMMGIGCAAALMMATTARASYVLEIDTDGADDGVLTYHPNFAFGGDTTSASQSALSTAVGLTGGDSIFGGNGSNVDTYTVTYTPAVDGDNELTNPTAGLVLNQYGTVGSSLVAGATGEYNIYATWPHSNNMSGGPSVFTLTTGVNVLLSVLLDQNTAMPPRDVTGDGIPDAGTGGEWIPLGTVTLDANTTYTLIQESTAATYVSQRAAGYLFEAVPEPASLSLLGLGGLALLSRKGR